MRKLCIFTILFITAMNIGFLFALERNIINSDTTIYNAENEAYINDVRGFISEYNSLINNRPRRDEWEDYEVYKRNLDKWEKQLSDMKKGLFYIIVNKISFEPYDETNQVANIYIYLDNRLFAMRLGDYDFKRSLVFGVSFSNKYEAQKYYNAERSALKMKIFFKIEDINKNNEIKIIIIKSILYYYNDTLREWE